MTKNDQNDQNDQQTLTSRLNPLDLNQTLTRPKPADINQQTLTSRL